MIDPLLFKAKEGWLSSSELEAVLSELSQIARDGLNGETITYPKLSVVGRFKVQLTEHDLAAAQRELRGEPAHLEPKEIVDMPTTPYTPGIRDPYVLLEIVGEAGGKELAGAVEPFLNARMDPMLARIALQILCDYWGLYREYRNDIIRFLDGVPWDKEDDVRQIAIAVAGGSLRHGSDPELLKRLIDFAEDARNRELLREDAVSSLGRALGMSPQERSGRGLRPDSELGKLFIRRARTLAGNKQ